MPIVKDLAAKLVIVHIDTEHENTCHLIDRRLNNIRVGDERDGQLHYLCMKYRSATIIILCRFIHKSNCTVRKQLKFI